jgi:hypothetical protein
VSPVSAHVQCAAAVLELLTTSIQGATHSQVQATSFTKMVHMYHCLLTCCIAVALAALTAPVQSELVLAYSIQRHGARNVLPKSADLTESDAAGGPTLLPAGQQMCYTAGRAVSCDFSVVAF